jgi:translation initiation factor 3 subunit D
MRREHQHTLHTWLGFSLASPPIIAFSFLQSDLPKSEPTCLPPSPPYNDGLRSGFHPLQPRWTGPTGGHHRAALPRWGSASVPFAPFSHSNKLGSTTDWTCNPLGPAAYAVSRIAVFDFAWLEDLVGFASVGDTSFHLIDGKPSPHHPRFGPKWRFQQRPQLPQRHDEEVEVRRRKVEKEHAHRDHHW